MLTTLAASIPRSFVGGNVVSEGWMRQVSAETFPAKSR